MNHWAVEFIGKPWRSGALGPDAYNCWGLVRAVISQRLNLALPSLEIGSNENISALAQIILSRGWYPVFPPALEYDLIVMRRLGERHVGIAVEAGGKITVLHANGHQAVSGPVGCVVTQTPQQLAEEGYKTFELWRHDAVPCSL